MKRFDSSWLKTAVVAALKREASRGRWNGTNTPSGRAYLDRCTACHMPSGTILILTREYGYHTSGWWKNPDYEHCLHLSLSFRDPETGEKRARDRKLTSEWLELVFGDARTLVWSEPPAGPEGKRSDTWHYRLFFADEGYRVPILPRGEVYSKEFTEIGWKSFSEVQAELNAEATPL